MDLTLCYRAQDEGYLATIQMGTPPRDFLILMDSGSSDFWVGGEDCQLKRTDISTMQNYQRSYGGLTTRGGYYCIASPVLRVIMVRADRIGHVRGRKTY